jgi:carbonic anhydrase/acetyltransferase-like protein (isoleucine patch superfamily)
VKITNNVQMGGYSTIMKGSYIGLSAVLHQFTVIGAYSIVGMGSILNRNIPPAVLAIGSPARFLKINKTGVEKTGLDEFEWSAEYLESPSETTIHPKLRDEYVEYLGVCKERMRERKEITLFRSNQH